MTTDPGILKDLLERSFSQSAGVISSVRPEQMELPTPCSRFDVRALVGHMVFAANRVGVAGRRGDIVEDAVTKELEDSEWTPAFEQKAADAIAAWEEPGAFEGAIVLPFGTFPASVVASIYVLEQVMHSWDLSVASASSVELDPELAEAVLPIAKHMITPEIRGGDEMPFGPVVEVPEDAPPYEKLAGLTGRRPPIASDASAAARA